MQSDDERELVKLTGIQVMRAFRRMVDVEAFLAEASCNPALYLACYQARSDLDLDLVRAIQEGMSEIQDCLAVMEGPRPKDPFEYYKRIEDVLASLAYCYTLIRRFEREHTNSRFNTRQLGRVVMHSIMRANPRTRSE